MKAPKLSLVVKSWSMVTLHDKGIFTIRELADFCGVVVIIETADGDKLEAILPAKSWLELYEVFREVRIRGDSLGKRI